MCQYDCWERPGTYAGSVLVELIIVVQIQTLLPRTNHVKICLSELKQLLSQLTDGLSHMKKKQIFVDTTLTLAITTVDKVMIRTQRLRIM